MIPGFIISILTFPGVIVHEAGHLLFCRLRRVPVWDVCFFRFGNPAGYVIHDVPQDFLTTFLITIGPFLLNSLLCVVITVPAMLPVYSFDVYDPPSYLLIWLGLSIGMHAFPSNQDARALLARARAAAARYNLLAILSFPLAGLIYVVNLGRIVWLDLAYGVALGILLPMLLLDKV